MSSPLAALKPFETAGEIAWEPAGVITFKPSSLDYAENLKPSAIVAALGDLKYRTQTRDNKLVDFFLIGVLSIFIHGTVVDHFKGAAFEQEIIEPVKQPPKVQITLTRPQPKPVAPPPVKAEPPKPKVVPLKPPKPKPQPKLVEQPPVVEPPPVVDNTPVNTAPVAAPTAPAPVVEEKITAPTAGADYLHNQTPPYPEVAQERGLEGRVVMKVHVQPDGKPDSVTVSKSSGHQILDDAAVKAVLQWTFVPAKRGDTPIAGYVNVPYTFKLS